MSGGRSCCNYDESLGYGNDFDFKAVAVFSSEFYYDRVDGTYSGFRTQLSCN